MHLSIVIFDFMPPCDKNSSTTKSELLFFTRFSHVYQKCQIRKNAFALNAMKRNCFRRAFKHRMTPPGEEGGNQNRLIGREGDKRYRYTTHLLLNVKELKFSIV